MDEAQNLQIDNQYVADPAAQAGDDDSNRPSISPENLTEFIKYIVSNIVTQRDQVEVMVMEDVPGSYTVHIKVAADDKGRVIGKKGNTINAIRALVRVFGKIIVLLQD
jgi:predicted RNA-binding protein YlqC (UPF0109 family)